MNENNLLITKYDKEKTIVIIDKHNINEKINNPSMLTKLL
jgi:hypothetical protein